MGSKQTAYGKGFIKGIAKKRSYNNDNMKIAIKGSIEMTFVIMNT